LHGGAIGDSLIGVYGPVGLLSVEELLQELAHFGDSGGSAHKYDLVNLIFGHATVLEHLLDWWNAVFEHAKTEFLELGSGDQTVEVFRLG
jgi:NAD-specific glutamate dehydrogenase